MEDEDIYHTKCVITGIGSSFATNMVVAEFQQP